MNPPRPLAHDLVARLGTALGTLGDEDRPAMRLASVELRQIAGLTAGGSLPLAVGTHELGPADAVGPKLETGEVGAVAFRLTVDEDRTVRIAVGTGEVRIDGEPVGQPRIVGGGIIDAGSAAFVVRPTRIQVVEGDTADLGPLTAPRRIQVPASPAAPAGGLRHRRARLDHERRMAETAGRLASALRQAAAQSAAVRRAAYPDPEELVHRARYGEPLWQRGPQPVAPGLLPVALGSAPWQPPVDVAGPVDDAISQVLATHRTVHLVPLLVDLGAGTLAVAGPRRATLAVVRYLVLALSVTLPPELLAVALSTTAPDEWRWLGPVAAGRAPARSPEGHVLHLVDGDAEPVRGAGGGRRLGPVVVLPPGAVVPDGTVTTLELDGDRITVVRNRDDARTGAGIPLGLSEAVTAAALESLVARHGRVSRRVTQRTAHDPSRPRPLD
jgi:hypothetical protein